jgi:hypothetical protein
MSIIRLDVPWRIEVVLSGWSLRQSRAKSFPDRADRNMVKYMYQLKHLWQILKNYLVNELTSLTPKGDGDHISDVLGWD